MEDHRIEPDVPLERAMLVLLYTYIPKCKIQNTKLVEDVSIVIIIMNVRLFN